MVLNIPQYSYNNIIESNVIVIRILVARFLHPGALLPFYLFWHRLEHKNNESQEVFNKIFFLTTMSSELLKYLNEQLGVFFNVKQQKWS